ncbi:MAG: FGGY-family carbohydrate kinase [Frankiales bacterium]|nr:FGGY-family carbohydrate kinase [Frankiales bacterium]
MLVAGLDVGGSAVKAWVASVDGAVLAELSVPLTSVRPALHRVELDPAAWEGACRSALVGVVEQAGRPGGDYLGVTVSTLRQGFVLLDSEGAVLSNGVLNSDRRGAAHADVLAGTHDLTGHWPAPELTLPKLLAIREQEPARWVATRRVLFLHDWLIWRMTGLQVTEVSYACAGGMADVAARDWARDLLGDCGIGPELLAPVVESGTLVGELTAGWGLPLSLPVVSGCGDTQLAAVGVGGLGHGVVTVVAGSSTPVQAATDAPVRDPLARPWVSTHASPDRWAVEGNAGYPGSFSGWWDGLVTGPENDTSRGVLAVTATPYWSQETWQVKPPAALLGLRPDTTAGDVRAALLEAHAYAVRGNVEDLERVLGRRASAVVVCGGGAAGRLPALLAQVLGRDVHVAHGSAAVARAGAALVGRAVGAHAHLPGLPGRVLPAGDAGAHDEAYARWCAVHATLRAALPEEDR